MRKLKISSNQTFTALALLWTVFIWWNSSQNGTESSMQSLWVLKIAAPVFDLVGIPSDIQHLVIRKIAHMTEYAVLTAFWYGSYLKRKIPAVLIISAITAAFDETIQLFVPGRCGAFTDVLIDIAGAVSAVILLNIILRILRIKNK